MNKLIAEVKTAFSQPHIINTGDMVYISEMLILNSCDVNPSAKEKFFNDRELKDKKMKYWAKDGIISLIAELKFEKIFTHFENTQS
ncbi:MAG: hypothetical protein ACD_28C00192G0005 [uncultured bacterium]|nr:MAG: hypothetical protein ACD_28C00192G0005 [uncultured bacterium]